VIDERARAAIEASDFAALLNLIDGACAARDWDVLAEFRVHFSHALERGKQLWGVDEHIRYRLALEAPASIAAGVVNEGPARHTLGPMPEVAASTHTWSELEPHLAPGPWRAMVAHERVVRGEDLTGADVDPAVLELPLRLEPWEPRYQLATYHSDHVDFVTPVRPTMSWHDIKPPASTADEDEATEAMLAIVSGWVTESSGRAEVRAVEGTAHHAVAALGLHHAGFAPIDGATALAWMGWAGAVGGRYGHRRGAATGRFAAWWAATAIGAIDWPPDADELGHTIDELSWYLWSDGTAGGWTLNMAVEDPDEDVAFAIGAVDLSPDE
jgi:hypothetical protein